MNDLDRAIQDGIAPWTEIEGQTEYYVIYRDKFPVTPGHLLFVPKYNQSDCVLRCFMAAFTEGELLKKTRHCDGFNVGINVGESAGQTVMYPHVHLILRKNGDCADPVGGVRGVIPGQQNYKKPGYKNPTDK